jgi:hypothetical protein
MDYYTDLRNHLNRSADLIQRDDVCAIYCLTKREMETVPMGNANERQLRELVAAVLPRGSNVIAFEWSRAALAGSGFNLLEPPSPDRAREAGLAPIAETMKSAGAEYMVIPASLSDPAGEGLLDKCRKLWPVVLDQGHVCTVFELRPANGASR